MYGFEPSSLEFSPAGLKFVTNMEYGGSKRAQGFVVYFSGPAVNLLLALVLYILKADTINVYINLYLALFNLLPIIPLDGSSIIFSALRPVKGIIKSMKITASISVIGTILFTGVFVFLAMYSKNFFFLLYPAALTTIMYVEIKSKRIEAAILNISALLKRKNRISAKGSYPIRYIAVMSRLTLFEVLPLLDHDCLHIVSVLNDDFSIAGNLTEFQILNAFSDDPSKTIASVLSMKRLF
jgi:stage IV sporulation protein FB